MTVENETVTVAGNGLASLTDPFVALFHVKMGSHQQWRAAGVLRGLVEEQELSRADQVFIWSEFSRHVEETGHWVTPPPGDLVEDALYKLMVQAPDASLLGTAHRFLAPRLRFLGETMTNIIKECALPNPHLPLPLQAAHHLELGASYSHLLSRPEELLANLTETYPELAGLPRDLVFQTAATQPFPDEWFVDAFPLPLPRKKRSLS